MGHLDDAAHHVGAALVDIDVLHEAAIDLQRIDRIVGELIDFFESRGVHVVLLSEYGITPVERPIHLNRLFREQGWITIKEELGLERLDCGNSKAFAVADHQVAHVYINDTSIESRIRSLLETTPGVASVWGAEEKRANGISHQRAGNLIVTSAENAWFTYYYWMDEDRAPDFARTVDIHRKPGYDPAELFIDPSIRFPKTRIATRFLQKKLGFRMLMDVIPLDPTLVKGSHGSIPKNRADWPVLIAGKNVPLHSCEISSTDIHDIIVNS